MATVNNNKRNSPFKRRPATFMVSSVPKVAFNFKKRKDINKLEVNNETPITTAILEITNNNNNNNNINNINKETPSSPTLNQLKDLSINDTCTDSPKSLEETTSISASTSTPTTILASASIEAKTNLNELSQGSNLVSSISTLHLSNESDKLLKTPSSANSSGNGKTPKTIKRVKYADEVNQDSNNEKNQLVNIYHINNNEDQNEIRDSNNYNNNGNNNNHDNNNNNESIPRTPSKNPEKIPTSRESTQRIAILKNILLEKLKNTPPHLKKHVREINKLFLLQVAKIPIPKQDQQQAITKRQILEQEQLSIINKAKNNFNNNSTVDDSLNSSNGNNPNSDVNNSNNKISIPPNIGNLKNLELLIRIDTLKNLIEKWSNEEKHWKTLLKEYSSSGKEGIILQTPSRTKLAATSNVHSSHKKQITTNKSKNNQKDNTNNTNNGLMVLNNTNDINNINANNNSNNTTGLNDVRMKQITDNISKLSIQLDEFLPKLKQIQKNSLEIEKFYDETSLHYQKQSFKNLKDVENPKKLIKNLLSNPIQLSNTLPHNNSINNE
ncbi:hypothetical protein DICPUDRAFT_152830 [Dictyostelium purpureum]|uniref:Uncharacterized protein n=1 Tax=Dictyostelium purpureum TaxID=5786 RepID=F0ZMD6_DICPU|nr:uncharacterized protein DICPUDRAFT_152830 [Dictyostelium purpureum]EGC34881.1 hypothetical protein DICPUDRAFT_152830 [Dictyostelium purpureum]|eukprot:XP_003288573.1 hypothetical protein DICPUDRAFT_152830 [Dictyostelium purpureum]